MRRMSIALIAVGAFLIVLAPMIRFYVYPRLAVAPVNQISETGLEAKGATIFDAATLKEIVTDLSIKVSTVGDAKAPDKYPGSVSYVNTTVTTDSAGTMVGPNGEVRGEVERMTFDQRSGEATPGVDTDFVASEVDTNGNPVQQRVIHTGLVAKFPFETEKKSYDFWDQTLLKSTPINYSETTKIEGMEVYKFNQVIPATEYSSVQLPLNLLGGEGTENVTAPMMYSVDRTLWVEPHTGVIIKRVEAQNNTIDYNGEPQITTTKATVTYDEKTIRKNIDDYGSQGTMLNIVRNVVPQVGFVLGLLMLVGGVLLGRRKPTDTGAPAQKAYAGAHA